MEPEENKQETDSTEELQPYHGLEHFIEVLEGFVRDKNVRSWITEQIDLQRRARETEMEKTRAFECEKLNVELAFWRESMRWRVVLSISVLAAILVLSSNDKLDSPVLAGLMTAVVGSLFVSNKRE